MPVVAAEQQAASTCTIPVVKPGAPAAAPAAAGTAASRNCRPVAVGFCAELWASVSQPGGLFSTTLAHPFLTGLVDGSLSEESFKFYIVQGALYLRQYARALAMVASKAQRPAWTALLAQCVDEAWREESTFHSEFLAHFSTTVEAATAGVELAPLCHHYASFVTATVHERAFYEGLAAVLPCFVVYLEVAKALMPQGSPHALYQRFLDRFGGAEYEELTCKVAAMVNEVAEQLGGEQRQRMLSIFQQSCRLEYCFFDACYTRQAWPLLLPPPPPAPAS